MRTLKAGAAYFALVFSAGFVLGAIRTLWVVPRTGVRTAELMESPIMLCVIGLAAKRVKDRHPLRAGFMALGLLLIAEIAVAIGVRRQSLSEYVASRDPISGSVYLLLLAAFAVMPRLLAGRPSHAAPALLDAFIPHPVIRERHQILIHAPAELVMETARDFDIQSIALVRAIFWLRAKALGAKEERRPSRGLIADMRSLGWRILAEDRNRYFVAGAVCQPWNADPGFVGLDPQAFASFAVPGRVKIVWTLEAEPLGPALTRFATETRAAATDDVARARFRRYWMKFGLGILLIRRLLLRALRREAQVRFKTSSI